MAESGLSGIDIISLAKRIEEVFKPNSSTPILLKPGSAELRLLQRIRDEAHRFAITFHRSLRGKAQTHSVLDDIPGVGEIKKQALLNAFETSENIKNASIEELNSVSGIHLALAETIYNYFHKD